jgi:hypothetical protein
MGLRIELILVVTIITIIGGSFTMKLNDNADKIKPFTKEMEFTNTTFTEVDTKKLQAHAYGTHGVRDDGILTIKNLVYRTETIEALIANRGTYMGNIIYLEGDVVMDDTNGYVYETQQAEYDQLTEVLNITAPFVATKGKSVIKGDTFTYYTKKEEVYGTKIDAVVYTVDK